MAVLAAAAPPVAAATWSGPEVVATPADDRYRQFGAPHVAFGPGGTAAAAWTTAALFSDPYVRFQQHQSGFASKSVAGAWSGTRAEEVDLYGRLAVDRAGRVRWIAEHRDWDGYKGYETVSIVERSGRLSGAGPFFDRTRAIWPRQARNLASDTSASGASVAAWVNPSWASPTAATR